MGKFIKDEKGTSFVEFVLVLPIMLVMIGLIFDMGRAVHTKINLQHLTGEIQRTTVLYEEAGVTGGIRQYSNYKDIEQLVKKIIEDNANLDKSKLKYSIYESQPIRRKYIGHHYNGRGFNRVENWNDVSYVTVSLEYEMPYFMFITKTILGDSIKFSEQYTGMMYLGGDGYNP